MGNRVGYDLPSEGPFWLDFDGVGTTKWLNDVFLSSLPSGIREGTSRKLVSLTPERRFYVQEKEEVLVSE